MSLIEFKREQASSYNFRKFGFNSDIDTTTDPEDIWDYGGIYTFPSDSGETIYVSSSSSSDTSSFVVQGLDSNFYEKTETVTLNGQTSVEVGSFSRVYRAFNDSSTDLNGDVYMYTTGTVSAGVPQTATTVKAQVLTGFQQTQMAIYTVPADYTAYVCDVCCSAPRLANQTIAIQMHLDCREYDKVFRTQLVFGVNDSIYQDQLFAPIVLPPKTDIRLRAEQVYSSNTPVAVSFDMYLKRNY